MARGSMSAELRRPAFWGALFFATPVIGVAWQLIGERFPQVREVLTYSNRSAGN